VQFIAQATDNNGGLVTALQTTTILDTPPTMTTLTASPAPLTQPGGALTLTATGKDIDGTVAKVDFYYLPAGVSMPNTATDFLIGSAMTGTAYGWTLVSKNTSSFATGAVRYYAVATDNNGVASAPLMINGTVNVPPTIGSLALTNPAYRGATMVLTAQNVLDTAPGTIAKVAFYLDSSGDGLVETTDKLLGTGVLVAGTHDYKLTASTVGFPLGRCSSSRRRRTTTAAL